MLLEGLLYSHFFNFQEWNSGTERRVILLNKLKHMIQYRGTRLLQQLYCNYLLHLLLKESVELNDALRGKDWKVKQYGKLIVN